MFTLGTHRSNAPSNLHLTQIIDTRALISDTTSTREPLNWGVLMSGTKVLATVAALALGSAAGASTIKQTIDYDFLTGPWAGWDAHVEYYYPDLPDGESIWPYSPVPGNAFVNFNGWVGVLDTSTALLVFSGSGNIMQPEPYLDFYFSWPGPTSDLLRAFLVWNTSNIGVWSRDQDDVLTYRCGGEDLNCTFQASVVPLPAALPLLGSALALGGLAFGRRKRSQKAKAGETTA